MKKTKKKNCELLILRSTGSADFEIRTVRRGDVHYLRMHECRECSSKVREIRERALFFVVWHALNIINEKNKKKTIKNKKQNTE